MINKVTKLLFQCYKSFTYKLLDLFLILNKKGNPIYLRTCSGKENRRVWSLVDITSAESHTTSINGFSIFTEQKKKRIHFKSKN